MKIRIQSEDGNGYNARFTSVETGQSLDYITEATIHYATTKDITAELTQLAPIVDMVAEATIKHVCPCCGQATGGECAEVNYTDGTGKKYQGVLYVVEDDKHE